jgi:trans-aconitate methyltransferase
LQYILDYIEQRDAMKLISGEFVDIGVRHWADLGCGGGKFTKAMAELLPFGSYVHAIVKDHQFLPTRINEVSIGFKQTNFICDDLMLNDLDGILMANSLYYAQDKASLFTKLKPYLRDNPPVCNYGI